MKKVALKTKCWEFATRSLECLPWKACAPFVDNRRSPLIHRPIAVATFKGFKRPHLAIKFLCGNSATGTDKFTFLDSNLPEGKFVCARCEKVAKRTGLPSADELLGYHVHTGGLIAVQKCHTEAA